MLTIKRIAAVLMLLIVLGVGAPRAFAGEVSGPPGPIPPPPGELVSPPLGEMNAPPGETNSPPGDTQGPSARTVGGLGAWLVFQMLANGWNFR